MSSLANDRHTLCSSCRGNDCEESKKCNECAEWPKDVFDKYVKHQKALVSKSKKAKKDPDTLDPSESSSGGTSVILPGSSNKTGSDVGLSEERVRDLIQESINAISNSFSSVLKDSYQNISELMMTRFRVLGGRIIARM